MHTVTMKGNTLNLAGTLPTVGTPVPPFTLLANNLTPRTLDDSKGSVRIIVTVPSLDTGVCDMEVRRFNQEASALSDSIAILVVSCDLPFAQARWCGAAGVTRVETLSDHRAVAFGKDYGILISDLRLLARAIFVVNKENVLTYVELVPEVTHEPNYAAALDAAQKAL